MVIRAFIHPGVEDTGNMPPLRKYKGMTKKFITI
jgi:hypothetical protein